MLPFFRVPVSMSKNNDRQHMSKTNKNKKKLMTATTLSRQNRWRVVSPKFSLTTGVIAIQSILPRKDYLSVRFLPPLQHNGGEKCLPCLGHWKCISKRITAASLSRKKKKSVFITQGNPPNVQTKCRSPLLYWGGNGNLKIWTNKTEVVFMARELYVSNHVLFLYFK